MAPGEPSDLAAFVELSRLGHTAERLEELHTQISDVLGAITRLDEVDVTSVEPAVVYLRPIKAEREA
jgi:Asp-tRNA(Asn)/Glu-tRNA(Gln) amidotransferase C subunit